MKRRIALLLALSMLMLSLISACAAKNSASYDMAAPAAAAPAAMEAESAMYDSVNYAVQQSASTANAKADTGSGAPSEQAMQDADTRKIVYNANLGITADDPAAALAAVIERAQSLGGYLADSYTTNDDLGAVHASATLKVPADQLDALVTAAKALGKVNDYQLSSDDITLNYYDIKARLESAKAEETQLLKLLADCKSVEEILAVRNSLASVRSDIESYQGQINLWDNLVSYATLSLSVYRTPQPEVAKEKELLTIWKASDVWKNMQRGFVNSARFVVNAVSAVGIFLAAALIPAAILFAVVVLPILLVKKNRRKKVAKQAAEKASETTPQA